MTPPTELNRHAFPPVKKRKKGRPLGVGKGYPNGRCPMPERIASFESKVSKLGPEECWPWLGYVEKETGYGKFTWDLRSNSAHRFAWIAANGPIPKGMHVLHKCDNRICQNPNHLFLGTNLDNIRDKISKGRQSNPPIHQKQTTEQVIEIRNLRYKLKMKLREIAERLGITMKMVESALYKWPKITT